MPCCIEAAAVVVVTVFIPAGLLGVRVRFLVKLLTGKAGKAGWVVISKLLIKKRLFINKNVLGREKHHALVPEGRAFLSHRSLITTTHNRFEDHRSSIITSLVSFCAFEKY